MEHRGAVFRTILARTMDTAAADDATAEAFARAYTHWDDTVAEHPSPRAWILKVAWNHYVSSWRGWASSP
jgi:DNA-directed RNA polymerase specialized sigma24 family protein